MHYTLYYTIPYYTILYYRAASDGGGVHAVNFGIATTTGRARQVPSLCLWTSAFPGVLYIYIYIYAFIKQKHRIYIYIYRERENNKKRRKHIYIYTYIHTYIHIYIHTYIQILYKRHHGSPASPAQS